MKNFQIVDQVTGKKFWISRSVAIVVIIYFKEGNNIYVLTEKRGKGCPDFVGYYCLPCGYVDWNETLEQAVIREIYEETGLKINKYHDIKFIGIQSDPKDNVNENITIRYEIEVQPHEIIDNLINGTINTNTQDREGEKDEVESFKIFNIPNELNNKFAWNHDELLVKWYYEKSRNN